MSYGLYLSASGVLTNTHRQDVIANNLANSETVGFKRHQPLFRERLAEAITARAPRASDPLLDLIGGGILAESTTIDFSQGELEHTGRNLDLAIVGSGYFAVRDGNETRLTRDGRLTVDRSGHLILGNGTGARVLDARLRPIVLDPASALNLQVTEDGQISAAGEPVARIAVFEVPDESQLVKLGGTLLSYPPDHRLRTSAATLRSQFLERSNVDPILEMTQLLDAHRQLEANANMIRYQDQTLGKLVNEVGKI
jgi:flagellar basal-body rod protein FlgF